MKQAIIIRSDIKLSKGKIAAQAAHASLEAYKKTTFLNKAAWELQGQKKVVLKVNSEEELILIFGKCKNEKLPVSIIRDAGKTQVTPGTLTAVGIGPAKEAEIDKVVGKLKLL
ncbi:MAG: peptidyl-tRNA hydrolase Pth2 [DPANN group archaeon]|nr:peptidyl-tRNA hydrolase Pth2 [DPANN group archaeon]